MSSRGRIGIRLHLDTAVLTGDLDTIDAHMTVGVGRVWKQARREPIEDGRASDAAVGRISFDWTGQNAPGLSLVERARIEERLRQVVARATSAATAAIAAAIDTATSLLDDAPPSAPAVPETWTVRDVEFRAPLGRLLAAITKAESARSRAQLDAWKLFYTDMLQQPLAAVASVVDVLQPAPGPKLLESLKRRSADRFGTATAYAYYYVWSAERRGQLVELDAKHLSAALPVLVPPRAEHLDGEVEAGVRFAFVAFGMPELALGDVALIGDTVAVQVPFDTLIDFLTFDRVAHSFHLTDEQLADALTEWSDFGITVHIVPLTARRDVSVSSLRTLALAQAREFDARAATFGELRLLTRSLLTEVPPEVADALRPLADDVTLDAQNETGQAQWRTNARGVFMYPLLDQVIPGLVGRIAIKVVVREKFAPEVLRVLGLSDTAARSLQLGRLIDQLDPGDWLVFQLLLDELDRSHALGLFFDVVAAAEGWFLENRRRRTKVTGLAVQTKYARDPALLRLIEAARFHGFGESMFISPMPQFDVAGQSILLPGRADQRVFARGPSTDDKRGVVSEASDGFYSEKAKVYQPGPELMTKLSKPARKKVGEIVRRMACSSSETMTEKELINEAMKGAMKELVPPPEEKDFVAITMRSSLRVLSLEEPLIDGVPQLRIRVESVARIGEGPWEATAHAELITPGDFAARLTSYNVQHMVNALTVLLMAEMAIGGAIFIVVAGIATLGELVLMLVVSEVIWLWTTPAEERTVEGFLEAALFAELQLVGFKFLSGATALLATPFKLVAGRFTGQLLGSTATKWIAFLLRSGVTAAEVGTVGMIDLFANDLFHMTRCRGLSSAGNYKERFWSGFKLGLFFEFAVIPGAGLIARIPAVKSGLAKATTYLDAAVLLRGTGLSYRQIAGDLLSGQRRFEEVLLKNLDNASVVQPLIEGGRRTTSEFLGVLWKEVQGVYEQRAYRALFELLNTPLDAAAGKGLARLIATRTEKEIDTALQALVREKGAGVDLMRLFGRVDERAAAELMKPANLMRLARSPRTMAALLQNPADAFLILGRSFRQSIDQFENFLGAIEKLPLDARDSLLRVFREAERAATNGVRIRLVSFDAATGEATLAAQDVATGRYAMAKVNVHTGAGTIVGPHGETAPISNFRLVPRRPALDMGAGSPVATDAQNALDGPARSLSASPQRLALPLPRYHTLAEILPDPARPFVVPDIERGYQAYLTRPGRVAAPLPRDEWVRATSRGPRNELVRWLGPNFVLAGGEPVFIRLAGIARPATLADERLAALMARLDADTAALTARYDPVRAAGPVPGEVNLANFNILKGNVGELLARPIRVDIEAGIRKQFPNATTYDGLRMSLPNPDGSLGSPVLFSDGVIAESAGQNLVVRAVVETKAGASGGQQGTEQIFEWIENRVEVGARLVLQDGRRYVYDPEGTIRDPDGSVPPRVIFLQSARRFLISATGAEELGAGSSMGIAPPVVRYALPATAQELNYLTRLVAEARAANPASSVATPAAGTPPGQGGGGSAP